MNATNRQAQERDHFDRLAEEYGDHWWGNRTAAGKTRQDARAERAIQILGLETGVRVLELGCGGGDFTFRIALSEADLVAVDVSPKLIDLCRARSTQPNLRFEVEDASELSFPEAAFDAVIGNSVLHHLDLTSVLAEIRRVLVPGGRMFFTEPNLLNPQIALEKKVKVVGRYLQNSPDETAFLRWRLRRRLQKMGFESTSVTPFDFLHPATPKPLLGFVRGVGWVFERLPVIREIAGSLEIVARKPRTTEGGP